MKDNFKQLVSILRAGGVAVIRTDTLYGLVARADDQEAVAKVYRLKHRNPLKSCIILSDSPRSAYANVDELADDIVKFSDRPTSFLIESDSAPEWLLRENNLLAYRVPNDEYLRMLLAETGPLIAPSANREGEKPASNIEEAKAYFGDQVDMYVDGGQVPDDVQPSRLLRIHTDGSLEQLR